MSIFNEKPISDTSSEEELIDKRTLYIFPTDTYYIACYNIIKDEIVFINFFTDSTIFKDELLPSQEGKYSMRIDTLRCYWRKIQNISNYNKYSYQTEMSQEYFKRTFFSEFLCYEDKGLFNNHSCHSLPCVFQKYKGVSLDVVIHQSLFSEEGVLVNKDCMSKIDAYKCSMIVPFLYIVDVIIKEVIVDFREELSKELKALRNDKTIYNKQHNDNDNDDNDNDDNDDNDNSNINRRSPISKGYDSKKDHLYNHNTSDGKLANLLDLMIKILDDDSKTPNNYRYVLKLEKYEEFLYGEYSIGSYNCIRKYVREFERVKLILFKKPLYETNPTLSHYPPIIFIPKNKQFYYQTLLEAYMTNYLPNCAIFRFDQIKERQLEQFTKVRANHQSELRKYTESGECDFPFTLTVVSIINLKVLKKWLNDNEYMKNEMVLPNFTEFQSKSEFEKSRTYKIRSCFEKMMCKKKNHGEGESYSNTLNKVEDMEMILKRTNTKLQRQCTIKTLDDAKNIMDNGIIETSSERTKDEEKKRHKDMAVIKKAMKENVKFEIELNTLGEIKKQADFNLIKATKNLKAKTYDNQTESKLKTIKPFFNDENKPQYLKRYHFNFEPVFIQVKVDLLYGSYKITTYESNFILINETQMHLNDTIVFNNKEHKYLISHLPRETRVGFTVLGFHRNHIDSVSLGSCQIPLYQDNGVMTSGNIRVSLWPFFTSDPKFNCCSSFQFKTTTMINEQKKQYEDEEKTIEEIQRKEKEKKEREIKEIIDNELNGIRGRDKSKNNDKGKGSNKGNNDKSRENQYNNKQKKSKINIVDYMYQKYEKETIDEKNYCYIVINFPTFAKPLAHVPKTPSSYRDFLDNISKSNQRNNNDKNKNLNMNNIHSNNNNNNTSNNNNIHNSNNKDKNPPNVFDKLYGTMIEDMTSLLSKWGDLEEVPNEKAQDKSKDKYKTNNNDKDQINITLDDNKNISKDTPIITDLLTIDKIEKNLEHIGTIIKKDPLTQLTQEERDQVLICRDYLSTMPNSIEVFLRSIDWFNPLHSYIAHLYLKRWAKLEPEDAIILLDSRFPDVQARQLAIQTLSAVSDDIIELFILQLCQCLQYESYILSPLADFLIQKSLANTKLIGTKFYWSSQVGSENFLFRDRLSIIITQWFMLAGPHTIESIETGIRLKEEFKLLSHKSKVIYTNVIEGGDSKVKTVTETLKAKLNKWNDDPTKYNFCLPIHPSYYVAKYMADKTKVFDSKMVPIKIPCQSSDGSVLDVMFKIGDDLRQDVLILQILRIMDKMWLENDLDLKISTYNVCPVELKCGFIEFIDATVIEDIQKSKSGGAMDTELLYNYMMQESNQISKDGRKLDINNQIENFIRSLAGYSVATCVLGIGDRHPGNVMLKKNGIFFHIDYGHILGHFKEKFGIRRERSAFLMTPDMAYVYTKTNREKDFQGYCVKAYNILRHNAQRLLNLFITMTSGGMPELTGMHEVMYFRDMLSLNKKNDEDAGNFFLTQLKESKNEKYRLFDNMIHNLVHQ